MPPNQRPDISQWRVVPQTRAATIEPRPEDQNRAADAPDDRRVRLSFSSEYPVSRWYGTEILDHSPGAADLSRLNDGAAVRDEHAGKQVGVVETAEIKDGKGYADIRLGRSARAKELLEDIRDGVVRNVSFRYLVHEAVLEKTDDTGDTYRATKWEAVHISFEPDPADPTVGVGRAVPAAGEAPAVRVLHREQPQPQQEDTTMGAKTEETPKTETAAAQTVTLTEGKPDTTARDIALLGQRFNRPDMAARAIAEGATFEAFRDDLMNAIGAKPAPTSANIGMSKQEVKRYSIVRAIRMLADGRPLDGIEAEADQAARKLYGRDPRGGIGFIMPHDVAESRDLVAGTGSAGGYTVATNLLTSAFIDLLRNRLVFQRAGARVLAGLVGNIAIPSQTGGATAYWVAENVAPTESQQTFGQVAMSPKTVGTYTDISRKLLLQSSMDVEAMVRSDLATILAIEIDRAGINGSGAGAEPTGVLNIAGTTTVALGANGAAPTWASIVALWQAVAVANADFGSLAFVTNAKAVGKLMTVQQATNLPFVVAEFPNAAGEFSMRGARGLCSNQVPSTLTKGASGAVCSAILWGNWADGILGLWGGTDVLIDPYTGGAAGTVRIRILQDVDIAFRHAASFAKIVDALTT